MNKLTKKPVIYIKLLGILACVFLTGCMSYYSKRGITYPLHVIQSAVKKHLPEGVRWTSRNHREMKSNYFHPGYYNEKYELSDRRAFRAQAHVWILGDRRPYHLKIKVYLEMRVSGGPSQVSSQKDLTVGRWTYVGTESMAAKGLGRTIYDDLLSGDRDWDLIDNFRPF